MTEPPPRDDAPRTPEPRGSRDARREWCLAALALLLYAALGFALLHDTLVGDQVLSAARCAVVLGPYPDALREGITADATRFSDSYRIFEPWMRFAADSLAEDGRLPFWYDQILLGVPLLGAGQPALFYPPNLLALLLGAPPSSHGWRALFKLVMGALSAFLLARHLRCSVVASLLAGLTFGYFGFSVVFLLWPLTNVSCLLPLLVLVALRAVERPSGGRLVALAAVCALQHLGGHPETALLSQLLAVVLGLAYARGLGLDLAASARRLLRVGVGFVLGALLAGPQLVPLLEYLLHSEALATRAGEQAVGAGASPGAAVIAAFVVCAGLGLLAGRRLLQPGRAILPWALLLLAALVAGTRAAMEAGGFVDLSSLLAADWTGGPERLRIPLNYIEGAAVYAGPALALVVAGVLAGANRRCVRTWTGVLLLALLVRGRAPGVLSLVESIPVVGLMPSGRAALVAQLAVAVLAALGYDALARPLAGGRTRQRYAALLLVPVLAVAVSMVWATANGVLGAGNVPDRAGDPTRRLRVDLAPPNPLTHGPTECHGTFLSPGAVASVRVVWSRNGQPVPAEFWRQHAAGPRGTGRFVFRAELPGDRLPALTATLRVLVTLEDGRSFSSPALQPPADLATILSSVPVLPIDGQALPQLLLLLGVGAGALVLMGRARGPRPLLLALTLAGVPWFTAQQFPRTPLDRYWPDSPAFQFLREVVPDGRVLTAKANAMAGVVAYYHIPQVLGFDALVPARTATLLRAAVAPSSGTTPFRDLPRGFAPDEHLVSLLAAHDSLGPATGFRVFFYDGYERGQRLEVARSDAPLPRARLVPAARVEPDDEAALAWLQDPASDLVGELVLSDGQPLEATLGAEAIGSATIVESRPDRVLLDVAPNGPAHLLLADTWFPGWEARVDGERRPIRRADVALRAVRVEPGDKRVEFRYEPGSYRLGQALAALGLAACLALALRRRD